MRLQHFFVLAFSACTAAYMKKTVYRSDELGARSADLLECLTQLEALLEVHPNKPLFDNGFKCGDRYFYVGSHSNSKWKNRDVVKKCATDLREAAEAGRTWIQCQIMSRGTSWKDAGWSPIGLQMCGWGGHEPCNPVEEAM